MLQRRGFFFIGTFLLLCACTARDASVLPPEVVLERAAQAVQGLQSARFTLKMRLEGLIPRVEEVTLESDGRLQDGGQQLAFTAHLEINEGRSGVPASSLTANVVVAGENEVYLRLDELKGDTPALLFGTGVPPTGKWWRLPPENVGAPGSALSPDPVLFRAQASVVRVERDRGIASVDGRRVYRYDTVVDADKLRAYLEEVARVRGDAFDSAAFEASWGKLAMQGTLWIDVETYFVRRLEWTFAPLSGEDGLRGELRMTMTDHNSAEPISPPSDAEEFPWPMMPPAALPLP